MNSRRLLQLALSFILLAVGPAALACTACYGKSDSELAQGMNMGIFTLLGFIGFVLVGVAAFFVFLIRRAARMAAAAQPAVASN
jgi:heme/copper-type cytochrome/quinol oxidase subunit 2